MVRQYPHTANVTWTEPGGTDDNGYQLPPVTTNVQLVCRGEPNFKNAVVYLNDGTAFVYKYLIQVQKGQPDVQQDADITVQLTDKEITGKVKLYSKDQLHQRIWI